MLLVAMVSLKIFSKKANQHSNKQIKFNNMHMFPLVSLLTKDHLYKYIFKTSCARSMSSSRVDDAGCTQVSVSICKQIYSLGSVELDHSDSCIAQLEFTINGEAPFLLQSKGLLFVSGSITNFFCQGEKRHAHN